MTYIGDFLASGSADYMFTTMGTAGTALALTGGSVVVYKNNGTVESSAGVTLTADFDARTGYNHVGINLAADTSFYSAGANFNAMLAVGTVESRSIAGYRLFSFSVENRNQKPTGGTVALATTAGTITNAILVRGGTVDLVTTTTTAGTITNPIAVRAGTVDVAGTVTNPILIRGGTADLVTTTTSAGTVTNPIRVYAGTVDVAGTVTNAILVRGGTVAEATALGANALTSTSLAASAATEIAEAVMTPAMSSFNYAAGSLGEAVDVTLPAVKSQTDLIKDDMAEATIKKNTAYSNFTFVMFDTSGDPVTGKTVTAERSLDGAAFASCANSVSEIGSGVYKINLAAGDLNADNVCLKFTATGCEPTIVSLFPES